MSLDCGGTRIAWRKLRDLRRCKLGTEWIWTVLGLGINYYRTNNPKKDAGVKPQYCLLVADVGALDQGPFDHQSLRL